MILKRVIASVLMACLTFGAVPLIKNNASNNIGIVYAVETQSGTCGDKLIWQYDGNGTLTISGSGDMYNYSALSQDMPWRKYNGELKDVVIKEGVTSIGVNAFYEMRSIVNITIPSTVSKIEDCAFQYCTSLIDVVIPEGVTEIAFQAFLGCRSLRSVFIPNTVTSISHLAFCGCDSLTQITLPASVAAISDRAFECENLSYIEILNPDCKIHNTSGVVVSDSAIISNGYNNLNSGDYYYNGIICGYENSTAQSYAEKYNRTFIAFDENGHPPHIVNEYTGPTLEDIKALQAFLLNKDYVGCGKVIDVDGDGIVDVFDLCLAKRQLLKSGAPSLVNFSADYYDIYLNTEEDVSFTVDVTSIGVLPKNAIAVYDDKNDFVSYMNDDGVNGDIVADDGIYTAQVMLSSDEIQVVDYYAATNQVKSNSFEICFYRDLTDDEFTGFFKLHDLISGLSFEEACAYVKSSDEVKSYTIDENNQIITYQSIYNIHGSWEAYSNISKGTGKFAISDSEGRNYDAVESVISDSEISPRWSKKNVIVLRPFKGSDFTYDDFKTAGKLIADAFDSSLTVVDDGDVTIAQMKNLASYGAILIDSHGTLKNNKTPYMLIGEELSEVDFLCDSIYYLQHVSYSADYISGRIYCSGYKDRLAVGEKFFEKYYYDNSLNNSFCFLGTCYSMYDNSIADTLISKGAGAVVGYTHKVSVGYCNNTLFESVLNSMVLSADTVNHSVIEAKRIYGNVDPENSQTTIKMRGKTNYKIVSSIKQDGTLSGTVCDASDRSTAISGAKIYAYQGYKLINYATADKNGNYSMKVVEGDYTIKIVADGYITLTNYVSVPGGETTYLETFLLVEKSDETDGIASGQIIDALTGDGLDNVSLTIRAGWNNKTQGSIVRKTWTDSDGNYSVTLPLGNYTLYAEKDGYISGVVNIVVNPGETDSQNGSISPEIEGNSYRIVLTWGENPNDLDSHVEGMLSSGSSFHVDYNNKTVSDNGVTICNLDVDDTSSYGPETITLETYTNKPYYYYIHRYAGSGTLSSSEAQVKLYQGERLIATYNVPTSKGDSDYWNVFAIINGKIVLRNTITSSADTSYTK